MAITRMQRGPCRFLDNDLHFLDSHLCDLCFGIEMIRYRSTFLRNNLSPAHAGLFAALVVEATARERLPCVSRLSLRPSSRSWVSFIVAAKQLLVEGSVEMPLRGSEGAR